MTEQATPTEYNEAENQRLMRAYFEDGCLCILGGTLAKLSPEVPDGEAAQIYHEKCTCSRNYEN